MRHLVRTWAGIALSRDYALSYDAAVCTARKLLRGRDFLHYGSQLIPERVESETWSMAWAYIREVDDVIDSLGSIEAREVLRSEWGEVLRAAKGEACRSRLLRHAWLRFFLENLRQYYSEAEREKVWRAIRELYWSALVDAARRGKSMGGREMLRLLKYKAVAFFRLYFTLGRLRMNGYEERVAELLGTALGLLDDLVDALYDLKMGYVNFTKAELWSLRASGLGLVLRQRGRAILRLLMRARRIAEHISNSLARRVVLRLTEAFAAPVLEGRLIPGASYFLKGGSLLLRLLPDDERVAYEVGHKLIKAFLSVPQLTPALLALWRRLTLEGAIHLKWCG